MNRPPSVSGRRPPMTGARQPPGTGMRMPPGTGAPGTARPGTRGGAAGGQGVLDAKLTVSDRPTTQQGLGGMKTGKKGPQRTVLDKSYYLGLLRTKMNELTAENNTLERGIDQANEENNSFLSYEKRAEALATEIKELQGQLGDYNTLVDKLNTETEMDEVLDDHQQLKAQNDREASNIDTIFTERTEIEQQVQQVEVEIQQCRRMADTLVEDMNPQTRQKYVQLKQANESLLRTLEQRQQELDALETKTKDMEEELSHSQIKQEAVRLYEQLHELDEKKNSLVLEEQSRGSPAEERERLLKQVKDDNVEIAGMDKRIKDMKDQLEQKREEIHGLEMDLEEHQGEKNQKYKELKKREETMNEFLETFEESKTQEIERKATLEENIVELLSHMSRGLARQKHMPTKKELARMQNDLSFKQTEMHKSESTASNLSGESTRLQMDLQKVESLEGKINNELVSLQEHIDKMTQELEVYSDLDKVKEMAHDKRKKLQDEKVTLAKRRDTFKKAMQELSMQYEAIKSQLNENETHSQLGNLERKWQHHEQNNFVMKEYIATKSMESDYRPLVAKVKSKLDEYNEIIKSALAKGSMR